MKLWEDFVKHTKEIFKERSNKSNPAPADGTKGGAPERKPRRQRKLNLEEWIVALWLGITEFWFSEKIKGALLIGKNLMAKEWLPALSLFPASGLILQPVSLFLRSSSLSTAKKFHALNKTFNKKIADFLSRIVKSFAEDED